MQIAKCIKFHEILLSYIKFQFYRAPSNSTKFNNPSNILSKTIIVHIIPKLAEMNNSWQINHPINQGIVGICSSSLKLHWLKAGLIWQISRKLANIAKSIISSIVVFCSVGKKEVYQKRNRKWKKASLCRLKFLPADYYS